MFIRCEPDAATVARALLQRSWKLVKFVGTFTDSRSREVILFAAGENSILVSGVVSPEQAWMKAKELARRMAVEHRGAFLEELWPGLSRRDRWLSNRARGHFCKRSTVPAGPNSKSPTPVESRHIVMKQVSAPGGCPFARRHAARRCAEMGAWDGWRRCSGARPHRRRGAGVVGV